MRVTPGKRGLNLLRLGEARDTRKRSLARPRCRAQEVRQRHAAGAEGTDLEEAAPTDAVAGRLPRPSVFDGDHSGDHIATLRRYPIPCSA